MKILHLTPRYLPALGGAEMTVAAISEYLVQQGHEVTVATTNALDIDYFWNQNSRAIAALNESIAGVAVRRFPVKHLPLLPVSYHAWRRGLWLLSHLGAPTPFLHQLARRTPAVPDLYTWLDLPATRFDLVAAMNIAYEPFLEAGRRFARHHGVPFVTIPFTHLGAGKQPASDKVSGFYTMSHQKATLLDSDLLIAQTPTERDFYAGEGLPAGRLTVIGAGVWPQNLSGGDGKRGRARFNLPADHPIVLSLGSLSRDKGTGQLLRAFDRLQRRIPAVELVLAGTPAADIQADLAAYSTSPRVHFLQRVTEEEKRDLLAAADLFAMPSRVDSFGLVYLEAWSYGKPVIAARTWGVSDLVLDGVNGRLVPFGEVEPLARTISELLHNPAERERLGAAGRQTMLAHVWPAKLTEIEALYAALAGRSS